MKNLLLCDNGKVKDISTLCKEYNVGIEVQSFYDPDYLLIENKNAIEDHIKCIENINVKTLHGPFADLCFGSFDKLIKEATMKRFDFAYDVAEKLGCKDIVLHHGYVPGTSPYSSWIKRGKMFWKEFFDNKNEEIKIHLENMLEHDPELIHEIINEVNNEYLDICLDTGHANCNSKVLVFNWIEKLGDKIGYVHLHNNFGKKDEHLGFTSGTIPFREMCLMLEKYTPNSKWAIECSEKDSIEGIKWLKKNNFWYK